MGMPAHEPGQGGRAAGREVSSRVLEVRAAIAAVRDPEIDEPLEALNFIVDTEVAGGLVAVSLRLPTFWCPANFVYLMAAEMRSAVLALPWVRGFELRLVDHFAADEINRAIGEGLDFAEAFPGQAARDLAELRRTFDGKAFLMRQSALVYILRRRGSDDDAIARLTAGELDRMAGADHELAAAWSAYRQKCEALHMEIHPQAPVVVDLQGTPIAPGDLQPHLRRVRSLVTSAGANGEMCRMLMAARREGIGCGTPHAIE